MSAALRRAAIVAWVACAGVAYAHDVTWYAGQPTGGWYEQTQGFAALFRAQTPALTIKPAPGAAYGNVSRVAQGEPALAWSLPPAITAAYAGTEPYRAPQRDLRLVMTGLGFVVTQLCAATDAPFHSVRELFESKAPVRIGAPKPGGSDEWELRRLLDFYHTSYADLQARGSKVMFGSFAELAEAYRKGEIDAFLINNAIPAGDVDKASQVRPTRILAMDADLLAYLERFGLAHTVVPAGAYARIAGGPVTTAAMANTIVTGAAMPDADVYTFTRTLIEHVDALRAIHPAFAAFDPRDAVRLADLPLHPGAAKAYREAGWIR
jgi:TRAP transporter TAXI family solute receptor